MEDDFNFERGGIMSGLGPKSIIRLRTFILASINVMNIRKCFPFHLHSSETESPEESFDCQRTCYQQVSGC